MQTAQTDWPGSQVKLMAVASLVPYARNAKMHPEAQVGQIAASIQEWGFTIPVLIDEHGMIIAGHCRVLAAQKLGLTEIPCITARGWSDAKKRAYVIADNKLTENGGWDSEVLALELTELLEEGYDVDLTGFAQTEIDSLLDDLVRDDGAADGEDDIPDVPEVPVTQPGDLWMLDNHRLLCGDSTRREDVDRVLQGVIPLLMVSDPPYGVNYDPSWRNQAGQSKTKRTGKVLNDDRADWRDAWALFPGDVAYVWHGALHAGTVAESLRAAGFNIRSQIVWAKDRLVLSRGDYHWQQEPLWYAVRRDGKGHWSGDRKQTTLWHIANAGQDTETTHGTQKPVECMRRPILNNSSPGQAIYEPFMGSGTTLIAAETTGRVCYGLELNPAYIDIAILRWQVLTGKAAVLAENGQTFAEREAAQRAAVKEDEQ